MAVKLAAPLILGGVKEIILTPYTDDAGLTIGTDSLTLDNIVADTTTITQEDNTSNPIEGETKDEPIFENITLGSFTFSAESGDIQPAILEAFFGYKKVTDTTVDNYLAPATYKAVWFKAEVKFDGGSLICPRVKSSSKIDASSLKTGIVRGTISGSCYAGKVGTTGDNVAPFYISVPKSGGSVRESVSPLNNETLISNETLIKNE